MNFTPEQMQRAKAAARRWAFVPGNYWVFTKFDKDDAFQAAALHLVETPEAGTTELYYAIVDAVRTLVPGYRQKNLLEIPSCDARSSGKEWDADLTDSTEPDKQLILKRNLAFIEARSDRKQLAELTLSGKKNTEIAKQLGVCPHTVTLHQKRLLKELHENH